MYGELQPLGGGDPIPLLKTELLVGRRESADIVLRFPTISGSHCELAVEDGIFGRFENSPKSTLTFSQFLLSLRFYISEVNNIESLFQKSEKLQRSDRRL